MTVHGTVSLDGLDGVRSVERIGDTVSFLYGGDIGSLLGVLSAGQIYDLTVSEPDLEEVFMHYYEKEGGDK